MVGLSNSRVGSSGGGIGCFDELLLKIMRLLQTFDVKMCTYRLIDKLFVILRKLIESLFPPPSSEKRR